MKLIDCFHFAKPNFLFQFRLQTDYSYRSSPNFNSNTPDLFTTSNSNASTPLYQQLPLNLPAPTEINNNNRIQMGGVQFIPSRLPSGEFALVMPNSANGNGGGSGGGGVISGIGGGGSSCGDGNSSSSTPDHWKPFYPMESLPLRQASALDLNETAITRSAFSNVTKKHLVDTSPLSPASSMSSIDDSSSSINQTDFHTSVDTSSPQRTPQKLNLSAFPTPPSGGSISLIPTSHHSTCHMQNSTLASMAASAATSATLQQPHVTSTTEQKATQKLRPISLEMHLKDSDLETITMDYRACSGDGTSKNANKKRPNSSHSPPNKDNDRNGTAAAMATASAVNNNNDDDDIDGDDLDADDFEPPLLKHKKSESKDYSIHSDDSNNNDDDQLEMCSGDMWRPW